MENVADSDEASSSMADDKAGEFHARVSMQQLSSIRPTGFGEICDTIMAIDNAMKWGYNQQAGSFRIMGCRGRQRSRRSHEEADN
ncbi:MAG: hypothetical protein MZV70_24780 [Desulfobacterales bacterium]|nr:hypothetical protein [Desulfobacterales bacterium]